MRNFLRWSAVLVISVSWFAQTGYAQSGGKKDATAPAESAQAGVVTKELAEAFFQRMFGFEQGISVKVAGIQPSPIADLTEVTTVFSTPEGQQTGKWYVSKDLKHVIVGEVLPFGADPFAADRAKLASAVSGPAKGPADAKMLIVEFADLECPACRDAAPTMEKLRNDFPQARFVFQSFPLPQHLWATKAAAYLDCIGRENPDRAFAFIDSVFSHQKEIEDAVRKTDAAGKISVDDAALTERLHQYTSAAGADPSRIQACTGTPETSERILRSQMLGTEVGVNSTPTLYLNGRRITNFNSSQYEALKAVVSFEAEQAK
jgi:protein-disulfide isomerase